MRVVELELATTMHDSPRHADHSAAFADQNDPSRMIARLQRLIAG